MRVRHWRTAWVLLATACGFEPSGGQAAAPPAVFREWWAATEACSGLSRPFERIDWYVVPGESFACPSGTCAGRWQASGEIFIAEAYWHHEMVVRHEMLHALIGRPGHPPEYFEQKCRLTWATWQATPGTPTLALQVPPLHDDP